MICFAIPWTSTWKKLVTTAVRTSPSARNHFLRINFVIPYPMTTLPKLVKKPLSRPSAFPRSFCGRNAAWGELRVAYRAKDYEQIVREFIGWIEESRLKSWSSYQILNIEYFHAPFSSDQCSADQQYLALLSIFDVLCNQLYLLSHFGLFEFEPLPVLYFNCSSTLQLTVSMFFPSRTSRMVFSPITLVSLTHWFSNQQWDIIILSLNPSLFPLPSLSKPFLAPSGSTLLLQFGSLRSLYWLLTPSRSSRSWKTTIEEMTPLKLVYKEAFPGWISYRSLYRARRETDYRYVIHQRQWQSS